MKTLLPWVIVVVLGAGLGVLYTSGQRQSAENAALRKDSEELQKLRAGADQAKAAQAQSENEELTQLRKDHEDLLRLRNEVRQLRDEKTQLTKQVQVASQTPAVNPQQQQALQQLQAENEKLKAASQQIQITAQVNGCVNNLRQIEAIKQQWAVDNRKPPGSLVSPQDLAPLFPGKAFPACPGGGAYTLNPVGLAPICNVPGHAVPKQ